MKTKLSLTLIGLLAATVPAAPAMADSGFYLLGSAGLTDTGGRKSQADTTITNLGVTAFTSQADEKDKGYKFQAGYRLTPHFAIEGGYMDLGRYTYNAVATVPVATRNGKGTIDAWNIDVIGSLPLTDQFSLLGKLGVAAHQLKFHCDGTGIPCANPDRKARGSSLHYGVGVQWALTQNWFVRGEYEVIRDVGDVFNFNGTTGTSEADLKMGSIGVGYRF
ncbi:MAG: outer membrane beta-barrel protein [Pseudomonadota bacterium]|jgi:OOP family OmpA-OmpF porin